LREREYNTTYQSKHQPLKIKAKIIMTRPLATLSAGFSALNLGFATYSGFETLDKIVSHENFTGSAISTAFSLGAAAICAIAALKTDN
jgi:hypothetical protein